MAWRERIEFWAPRQIKDETGSIYTSWGDEPRYVIYAERNDSRGAFTEDVDQATGLQSVSWRFPKPISGPPMPGWRIVDSTGITHVLDSCAVVEGTRGRKIDVFASKLPTPEDLT